MSVRILFFACKVRFIVTHFVLAFLSLHHNKHALQDVSPHGIWMLVDLKMLNIASGEFSRYVCGQHHCVL